MNFLNIHSTYFVYRHIREDNDTVFYVGRGKVMLKDRDKSITGVYWRAFSRFGRSDFWKNITKKTKYTVDIIYKSDDFNEIKEKEAEFIKIYGRSDLGLGTLCNLSDGGDGFGNVSNLSKEKKRNTWADRKICEKFREERSHDFYVYDMFGKYVGYFKNNIDCSNFIGCWRSSINKSYREKSSVKCYLIDRVFYENGIDVSNYKIIRNDSLLNVLKLDKEMNILCSYPNIKIASKNDSLSLSTIKRGIKSGELSGGYYWRLGNEVFNKNTLK